MMKIVFFQAHPDDLELNCPYLIHYLAAESKKKNIIKIVSVTKGEYGLPGAQYDKFKGDFLAKVRMRELAKAQSIHGIPTENIEFFGFIDGFVEFNNALIEKTLEYLRKERPDVIIASEPLYTWYFHKDHVNTGKAVFYIISKGLLNYTPKLLFYGSLGQNYFFPIMDQKLELVNRLIACHKTQFWLLNGMKFMIKPVGLIAGMHTKQSHYAEPYRKVYFTNKKKNKPGLLGYALSRFCYAHRQWYDARYPQNILDDIKRRQKELK